MVEGGAGRVFITFNNSFSYAPVPVCVSVHVFVCVQNTSFCQSAGGEGIKSHSVTALVDSVMLLY